LEKPTTQPTKLAKESEELLLFSKIRMLIASYNYGAVEKRSSAALRCKPRRSTYVYMRLAVRFFARLASEHF
jgi:hypothetical protein